MQCETKFQIVNVVIIPIYYNYLFIINYKIIINYQIRGNIIVTSTLKINYLRY